MVVGLPDIEVLNKEPSGALKNWMMSEEENSLAVRAFFSQSRQERNFLQFGIVSATENNRPSLSDMNEICYSG